jgi:hypothetical protein
MRKTRGLRDRPAASPLKPMPSSLERRRHAPRRAVDRAAALELSPAPKPAVPLRLSAADSPPRPRRTLREAYGLTRDHRFVGSLRKPFKLISELSEPFDVAGAVPRFLKEAGDLGPAALARRSLNVRRVEFLNALVRCRIAVKCPVERERPGGRRAATIES